MMIFNTGLTYLGSEASIYLMQKIYNNTTKPINFKDDVHKFLVGKALGNGFILEKYNINIIIFSRR